MIAGRNIIALVTVILLLSLEVFGADPRSDFDAKLGHVIAKLNREAQTDAEGAARLSSMIRREYGTTEDELKWATDREVSWGQIAALAYIQATTGRSFASMTAEEAHRDFWSYIERSEMSSEKMALSLERFLKKSESERNSRIFERLRNTRRVQALPDLGSGFGLFQEALDFRQIEVARTTKIHTVAIGKAKGEK